MRRCPNRGPFCAHTRLLVGELAQVGHLAARLCRVAALGVEQLHHGAVDERVRGVLAPLHLAVDDALVLALVSHVVHLRHKRFVRQEWVEDVVRVDREKVQQALVPGGSHRVARVVRRRPRVGAAREAAVGQLVEHALVRVELRAEEDGVLRTQKSHGRCY
eukprot:617720-Pleurochrysis_carterae.AAC.2